MEILLDRGVVTKMGFWMLPLFIILVAAVAILMAAWEDYHVGGVIVSLIVIVSCFLVIILMPQKTIAVPTSTHSYIVEITDETKYKELVDSGYELKQIYDNRNIYSITGDELENVSGI